MKVSYFETARCLAPGKLPSEWPVPPDAYDREAGAQAYRGMIERLRYVEELGFDWVSVSEHHYSPQRLTPAPISSAAHLAAYVGGILPTNFVGGSGTVIQQIERCRTEVGAGVVDLMFQNPVPGDLGFLMRSLELFGTKVLPHVRDI